jgi:hypothetical protein
MKMETTFNGGLEQTITCWGDSESYYAMSTSPTQGQINRVSNMVQEIQQAIETADGGVITKILDTDGTWKELVIANNQDLSQATSVWRFNINGLAHSNRYQGGTYTLAMDTQGRIVANVIQTGTLQDSAGKNSWNLDTGALTITDGSINISTTSSSFDVIKLRYNDGANNSVETDFSPTGLQAINYTNQSITLLSGLGIYMFNYGIDPNIMLLDIQPGSIRQRDTNGIVRQRLAGVDGLSQYDGNGKERARLTVNGLTFYDSSGNAVLTLSPNASGNITITPRVVATW